MTTLSYACSRAHIYSTVQNEILLMCECMFRVCGVYERCEYFICGLCIFIKHNNCQFVSDMRCACAI